MIRPEKLEELKGYVDELRTIQVLRQIPNTSGFLSINKKQCLINNSKTIVREQIIKNGKDGSAAIILPITKENNTLLVIQPRVFTRSTVGIELPAGYIEENEEPIIAAQRELIEETGYVPERMEYMGWHYQDQGCSSAINHSFIALNCEKKQEQHLDSDEYIRYFECTYEEALELADMNYINDGNSLLLLEKSKRLLKRR